MKIYLSILILFLCSCAYKAPLEVEHSSLAPKASENIFLVNGYEFAKGDEISYVKALLGDADYFTSDIHGDPVWRYSKYKIELRFDNSGKLKSWTDTSYLP